MAEKIFGIDLGTTNSALALYLGKVPEIVPVDGAHTFPSVVEFHADGTVETGRKPYFHKGKSNVVYSAKRDMGTDTVYTLTLEDGTKKEVTPVDVAAEVLRGINNKADPMYGEVKNVVITVPAYFNNAQRADTLRAAQQAGLNCVKIINEPTAASLAYGAQTTHEDYEEIIVIDVGGGTTDITCIAMTDIAEVHPYLNDLVKSGLYYNIMATGGNNKLGGDDYDAAIFQSMCEKLLLNGVDQDKIKSFCNPTALIPYIERWKVSHADNVDELATVLTLTAPSGEKLDVSLSHTDLEAGMHGFWDSIKKCIKECLTVKKIGADGSEVILGTRRLPKKCLLVGGSTKNPLLIAKIKEYYTETYGNSSEITIPSNDFADEAVALGAAIQGAMLTGEIQNIALKDVNPLPIGISTVAEVNGVPTEGVFSTLIMKDASIPVSTSFELSTVEDNQHEVNIDIYQGTSAYVKYNTHVGTVHLDDIPDGKAGEIIISVTLGIDINGMIVITTLCNGISHKATLDSVLKPVKTYTRAELQTAKIVESAIAYCKSTGDCTEEELAALQNWKIGERPPEYIITHRAKIREHAQNYTTQKVTENLKKYTDADESLATNVFGD